MRMHVSLHTFKKVTPRQSNFFCSCLRVHCYDDSRGGGGATFSLLSPTASSSGGYTKAQRRTMVLDRGKQAFADNPHCSRWPAAASVNTTQLHTDEATPKEDEECSDKTDGFECPAVEPTFSSAQLPAEFCNATLSLPHPCMFSLGARSSSGRNRSSCCRPHSAPALIIGATFALPRPASQPIDEAFSTTTLLPFDGAFCFVLFAVSNGPVHGAA